MTQLQYIKNQLKTSQLILKANPRDHFYVVLSISLTHVNTSLVGPFKHSNAPETNLSESCH